MTPPTISDSLELFEPDYLVTLDEIYHSGWAAAKRRRIGFVREAFLHFWPVGHKTKLIHVTGTNGKGSVIHYLEQGISATTGSWTGPHVFDYAERFHINGKKASHRDITTIYREILKPYQEEFMRNHPGESLTFSELGILLTLHLFERYDVQWGMMEVGNGGRYTPLMALDVEACILTNVGDDHPLTLGSEVWQRALEKAGVARPGVPFFTAVEEPALGYVSKSAAAEGADVFVLEDREIETVRQLRPNEPAFKQRNQALAGKVISHFFPDFDITKASMERHLPARFRKVASNVIADVAHNVNKISKLVEQLKLAYPGKKFNFLLGLSRSRDVRKVFEPILEVAERIVFTSASYAGQDPALLAGDLSEDFTGVEALPEPRKALEMEKERLKEGEILVLTGSAYMIDQALNPSPYIRHVNATFGRRGSQHKTP
ncbi:MAG: hypothetical protein GY765_07850 [bacterium]|nr:hypothetical protein [bacterium]